MLVSKSNRYFQFLSIVIFISFISCQKKSNSRTGEEDTASTVTTTVGAPSTTGSTQTITIPTGGTPSCTLNPKQVICSNYLPSTTLTYASGYQNNAIYELTNSAGNFYVHLYFYSNGIPASGTYSVNNSYPFDQPTYGKVGVKLYQSGTMPATGVGQSGSVYVVATGTNVTATFCSIPLDISFGSNTYTATASARIEK